jgi:CheY-like chemotaxis protein
VDDHADVRYQIRMHIADAGVGVEVIAEASGLESAVAALRTAAPDAVVMDARMPVVDGYEVAERLLALRPGLPIVLCSALVDEAVRRRAEAAGIRAVLSKDELESIATTVRGLVESDAR